MSNKLPPQPPPRIHPLQERMEARNRAMNTPMVCPRCSGTYFLEMQANQYSRGGYGSAEFQRLSISTFIVRVCLCGYPVGPSEQAGSFGAAGTEVAAFHESIRLAHEYLQKQELGEIIQQVATRKDVEDLRTEVSTQLEQMKEMAVTTANLDAEVEELKPIEPDPAVGKEAAPPPISAAGKPKGKQKKS